MRASKISLIAPSQEFAFFARELFKEWGESIHVALALHDEVLNIGQKLTENGIETIICAKAVESSLRAVVNVPIVALAPELMDIVKAIVRAKDWINSSCEAHYLQGDVVPTIGLSRSLNFLDAEWVGVLLGVTIRIVGVEEEESQSDCRAIVREMSDLALSGKAEAEYAYSNPRIFLAIPGRETVLSAVRQARELADERCKGQAESGQFKAMMQFFYEGIVVVDIHNIMIYANAAARAMLDDVIGRDLMNEIISGLPFEDALQYGQTRIGQFGQAHCEHLVYRIVPMTVANETVGAMLTIFDSRRFPLFREKTHRPKSDSGHWARFQFTDFFTEDETVKKMLEAAKKYAAVDSTLLITGETGTGKEIIAQSVHNHSNRRRGPFVAINFAALPESLLESELFGYESGSFTGARKDGKIGLFEQANNGTIFLDEIGEAPPGMQARLLRVVQEKVIMRVGGAKVIPVDVRILAATHRNLLDLIDKGLFRRDLYHRLNILQVRLPSLSERAGDVNRLVEHFNAKLSARLCKTPLCFSAAAGKMLLNYAWPGNVREVENMVERLLILKDGGAIVGVEDVTNALDIQSVPAVNIWNVPKGTMQEVERTLILEALRSCPSRNEAAHLLGISNTTLWRKLKKMQIERNDCNMQ
ncbi:MAG: sigma 54-interacting transcriptional regulator [Negativicutes bacterium]